MQIKYKQEDNEITEDVKLFTTLSGRTYNRQRPTSIILTNADFELIVTFDSVKQLSFLNWLTKDVIPCLDKSTKGYSINLTVSQLF